MLKRQVGNARFKFQEFFRSKFFHVSHVGLVAAPETVYTIVVGSNINEFRPEQEKVRYPDGISCNFE